MLVGGGTAIMPRIAQELYDFVGADDGEYLRVTEAVLRIFDRQEWLRANRARARIKVFVDKYGIDELRRQVEEELEGDWVAERDFDVERRAYLDDEEAHAPAPRPEGYASAPTATSRRSSASPAPTCAPSARRASRPSRWRSPAATSRPSSSAASRRSCASSAAATPARTVGQNLVLRWVRDESLYEVWTRLEALGLGEHGAQEVIDVVSCPGTDSCKLGITSSMGLNAAVRERLREMDITDALTKQIQIKMSGCPNGCGQHHIGNIGLYGASIKVGEHTIPAYVAHVGGTARRRRRVRHAAEGAPPRQARARRRRALAAHVRGRARDDRARRSTSSSPAWAPHASRRRPRSSRCRSSSASRT